MSRLLRTGLDTLSLIFIFSLIIMGFYLVLSVNGCAGHKAIGAETPAEVYLKARMTFNGFLSDYIDQKRAADPETRARWTAKIDPWFERAALALSAWGAAVKSADQGVAVQAQRAYLEIKDELVILLLDVFVK